MSDISSGVAVKSKASTARDKAEETTAAARAILDAEVAAREAKSARLRKLRMEKEAAEAADKEAAPAKRKTAARKRSSSTPAR
ncbi:MAG: hypothetical protein ACTHJ3_08275 [Pararhizobium sp.]